MGTSYCFKITDLSKQLSESGYIKQIESKILRLIEINNSAIIIHTDTLYQMETYLQAYWAVWHNSPFKDYTDNDIKKYIDSWEMGKTNKQTKIADEIGVSNELSHLISFYVKNIYLQPIYFHRAIKMYPDNLDPTTKIYQRYKYLNGNNAKDKYIERTQSIYQEFRRLLPNEDKEAIHDIRKILFFTESLIAGLPHYLYNSPILVQFIRSIFELKQMYDLVIPNNGLPRMNKYFNNVDISNYKVNYVHFEKDAVILENPDFTRENIEFWYQGAIDTFKLKGNVSKLIESAKLDNKKPICINDGWVIFEPKEHSEKKKYFEVQEEFSTLLKIRKQLDKFNLLDTTTHQLSDWKNIEQKINEFWNTLSTPTKELFLSNKNTELFKIIKTFPPQPIKEKNNSQFSVLEWATIFYYANETNLLPETRTIKNRMEKFIQIHKIKTTLNHFNNNYYTAKNRIHDKNDYPIEKLKLILPFLSKNYKKSVVKVKNDIEFLRAEKTEY